MNFRQSLSAIALTIVTFTRTTLAADLARANGSRLRSARAWQYALPVVKPAADGEVLDSQGRPVRLRELTRGRVTVMSFIYTRCTAVKRVPTRRVC